MPILNSGDRIGTVADRLRMTSGATREMLWSKLSDLEKTILWQTAPKDRRELLPDSIRREFSRCCCVRVYSQCIILDEPERESIIGRIPACGACARPVGNIKWEQAAPRGFTAELWREMMVQSSAYCRYRIMRHGPELTVLKTPSISGAK